MGLSSLSPRPFRNQPFRPSVSWRRRAWGYSVGGLIPFPVVLARENKIFEQLGLDVGALVSGDLQYASSKQSVPLSRVVDFAIAREVFRELQTK